MWVVGVVGTPHSMQRLAVVDVQLRAGARHPFAQLLQRRAGADRRQHARDGGRCCGALQGQQGWVQGAV